MPEMKNLCEGKQIKLKKERAVIGLILSLPLRVIEEVHLTIAQVQSVVPTIVQDQHYTTQTTLNTLVDEDYRLGRLPYHKLKWTQKKLLQIYTTC